MLFGPWKAAALLAAAAAVIGILYLLRERFRKVTVSYLPAWEQTRRMTPASALLRRFRKIVSYLVQVVIALLLVLSVTETGAVGERRARSVVLLVDTSASMASVDVKPSRLARGLAFARQVALSIGGGDRVLVVEMGDVPRVVQPWTGSALRAAQSLGELAAAPHRGCDAVAALRAAGAALDTAPAGADREVWIVSDGALGAQGEEGAAALRGAVEELAKGGTKVLQHRPGRAGDNMAVTVFSARQNLREKLTLSTAIGVARFGGGAAPAGGSGGGKKGECGAVGLTIRSGGGIVLSRLLGKEDVGKTTFIDLPAPADRVLEAKIAPAGPACAKDYLPLDDTARIVLPEELQLRILAITEDDPFITACLLLSELWKVEVVAPGQAPASAAYDVVVSNGAPVGEKIARKGTLYIRPSFPQFPLAAEGSIEAPRFDGYETDHPALRWTNLSNVNIARALLLRPRKEDRVIGFSQKGPLVVDMKGPGGRKDLALAFALDDTDMPMRTTLPLFFINAVYYLAGTALAVTKAAGSPGEADIAPRWIPAAAHATAPPAARAGGTAWIALLLAALLLSLVEWLTFHRRWTS